MFGKKKDDHHPDIIQGWKSMGLTWVKATEAAVNYSEEYM